MSRDLPKTTRTDGQQFSSVVRPLNPTEPGPLSEASSGERPTNLPEQNQRVGRLDYVLSPLSSAGSDTLNARGIRKIILEQSYRARVGHIGSALSVADIIAAVY